MLRRATKRTLLLAVAVSGGTRAYEEHTKEERFTRSMRLVYPGYSQEAARVQVLSRNQLEYTLK